MVSEPEDMVVMRFYCHLLGLGDSLFPGPRSQSQSQSLDNCSLDNSTTSEWIEQNILPLSEKLTQVLKYQESLSDRDVWPRRPV